MYRLPITVQSHNDHWCETCDRGFLNLSMLQRHVQQHQKCNIDGCQFVAHPKVVTKHIQMQHSSGLFKKIANLNNPDDIKKWIEDRKKKYPTKSNVDKKAAELKEKIDRGEKMGLKYDRSNSKIGDWKRKYPFSNENYHKQKAPFRFTSSHKLSANNTISSKKISNKDSLSKKDQKVIPTEDGNRKLKPFTGIRDILMDDDKEIDEEEDHGNYFIDDDCEVQENLANEPVVCGALSTLICNYGSSDEEIASAPQKIKEGQCPQITVKMVSQICPNLQKKTLNVQCGKLNTTDPNDNNQSDDDSAPEEIKICKSDTSSQKQVLQETVPGRSISEKNNKINGNIQRKKVVSRRSKPKLPSTLLQKLLSNEIRYERNIVLQCIRYIVKHNYFEKI